MAIEVHSKTKLSDNIIKIVKLWCMNKDIEKWQKQINTITLSFAIILVIALVITVGYLGV